MDIPRAELTALSGGALTWLTVGLLRGTWPELWFPMLKTRRARLALVAALAAMVTGPVAAIAGLSPIGLAEAVVSAFSLAVAIRQVTKRDKSQGERILGRYFDGVDRRNGDR